jgi:hypothetical protein
LEEKMGFVLVLGRGVYQWNQLVTVNSGIESIYTRVYIYIYIYIYIYVIVISVSCSFR